MGPIIFFLHPKFTESLFQFSKKALHLTPGLLYLLYIIAILWPIHFGDYYFYKNGMDKDFEQWYQKLGLLSMIVYFILSIRYYNVYKTHVSSSELCRFGFV
jgi:purine-cytosine permease-like protein